MSEGTRNLTGAQRSELLRTLEERFKRNERRHPGMDWEKIRLRLEPQEEKLWSLFEMERTGGEPDVVGRDETDGSYLFVDCAPESPAGRRNLCYDRKALDERKENKPENSVLDVAALMGIELLSEAGYRVLQQTGEYDLKTSSWVHTPEQIRRLGGALFCDRRYDTVFVYHNGASSYYGARGFRGMLKV